MISLRDETGAPVRRGRKLSSNTGSSAPEVLHRRKVAVSKNRALFTPDDDQSFVALVIEHLGKGAATKRGITAEEYVRIARAQWNSCRTDEVYAVKLLIDPLVQPEIAAELPADWISSGNPFCELLAVIDSTGELVNAPPGYVPPSYPNAHLMHVPGGSSFAGKSLDAAQPADYLIAFLDVLGFESLLNTIGLVELSRRYQELLTIALRPNSGSRPLNVGIAMVKGEPTVGLMWLPIEAAYFSDSLLLWARYHPGHVPIFLDRCSQVFCQALALGIPIRGAISVGTALLDKTKGIYLGLPLIEAVRLESRSNWIGVALGASWRLDALRIPIPPDRVFQFRPPLKEGGEQVFSGLVLDWPRVWREERDDSATEYLKDLSMTLSEDLLAKYTAATDFWEYSHANEAWFLPQGAKMLRLRDLGRRTATDSGSPPNPSSVTKGDHESNES
jgi:hypothetical protein